MEIRDYTVYDESQVLALYTSVHWTSYTDCPAMLRAAFAGSLLTLGAFEQEELVGLLRAVGDGASILYIQDLLLAPAYQRQGIGSRLMKEALARYPSVYETVLLTNDAPDMLAFYRACGLTLCRDAGCCGFMRVVRA